MTIALLYCVDRLLMVKEDLVKCMPRVLVVCTGNIIRSACAQAFLQQMYATLCPNWTVESAGTHAQNGQSIHPHAAKVLQAKGLNPDEHQAQILTPKLIQSSDIILIMEQVHRQIIENFYPTSCGKLFLFDDQGDVLDPLGGPIEQYQGVIDQIQQRTQQWAGKLSYLG